MELQTKIVNELHEICARAGSVPKQTIIDQLMALLKLAMAGAPQLLALIASLISLFGGNTPPTPPPAPPTQGTV